MIGSCPAFEKKNMPIIFRQISDKSEIETAYSIICERTKWLNARKIKQWTEPLPRAEFDQRQAKGENYGLFQDNKLAAFLSLLNYPNPYWKDELGMIPECWLETLATALDFSGQEIGKKAVMKAINCLQGQGQSRLFLDCVKLNNFLPNYYSEVGFKKVGEKDILYPKCGLTRMVLMTYEFR